MFPADLVQTPADVLVTIWDSESAGDSMKLARELRSEGLRVYLYPVRNVKLGIQVKYASKLGVPFVAVVGPEERERSEVAVKDMRSGEQQVVKRGDAGAMVREALKNKSE